MAKRNINKHRKVKGLYMLFIPGKFLQLINTQHPKIRSFLHTNDKWTKKEIRETIPFTIISNNIEYLGGTSNQASKKLA